MTLSLLTRTCSSSMQGFPLLSGAVYMYVLHSTILPYCLVSLVMHMLCACMCTSISRQNTCMAVCGGGSVVTDCVPAIWILAVTYVNIVSMYMGLVIELVHGMFMHFSYAALI